MENKLRKIVTNIIDEIGYGFQESIYQKAVYFELKSQSVDVELEVSKPVYYNGNLLGKVRLDMIINNKVIVEFKSKETISSRDINQTKRYKFITGIEEAYLITICDCNFTVIRV